MSSLLLGLGSLGNALLPGLLGLGGGILAHFELSGCLDG